MSTHKDNTVSQPSLGSGENASKRPELLNGTYFGRYRWEIEPLIDSSTFWQFMDLLLEEYVQTGYGFYVNRDLLLDAFVERKLYVQRTNIDSKYENLELKNISEYQTSETSKYDDLWNLYQKTTPTATFSDEMIFPSFCIWDREQFQVLWTAPQWRHLGAAKRFVEHFKPASAYALPESVDFWNKLNIPISTIAPAHNANPMAIRYPLDYLNKVITGIIESAPPAFGDKFPSKKRKRSLTNYPKDDIDLEPKTKQPHL